MTMVDVLKREHHKRSILLHRLVIAFFIALVIIIYNVPAVWKGLSLSAFKVKMHSVIEHPHGNYNKSRRRFGENKIDKHEFESRSKNNKMTSHGKYQGVKTNEHKIKPLENSKWDQRNRLRLCGSGWQDRYAQLHSEILLSRDSSERYLAYTCPGNRQGCCGYGNRLRAVVSLFYLAILTDRAFVIDWQTPEPIENHLIPKRIQWNHTAPLDVCTGLETRRHYWGTASAHLREAEGWITQDSKHFKNWFTRTNLSSYFDTPVEEVTTIWYFVEGGINNNPYLMRRAKELNITPLISLDVPKYALIGCAFDFLFEKSRAVENLLRVWKEEVRRKSNGPVIGIHIRTGDHQFDYYSSEDERSNNLKNITRLNGFFNCARQIEKTVFKLKEIANNAVWFLSTDHNRVKEFAREKFPEKVVTTNLTIQHLDILHNTTVLNDTIQCNFSTGINGTAFCYDITPFNKSLFCANRMNRTSLSGNSTIFNDTNLYTKGIIAMLVDHFILSECDFLILCDSSFSSTAVGLGMRGNSFVFGDYECFDYNRAQSFRKLSFFRRKRSVIPISNL